MYSTTDSEYMFGLKSTRNNFQAFFNLKVFRGEGGGEWAFLYYSVRKLADFPLSILSVTMLLLTDFSRHPTQRMLFFVFTQLTSVCNF